MGQHKKERTDDYKTRCDRAAATACAVENIESYEHIQLLKRLFIFSFTGVWTAEHPQIGAWNG
jgi:hypothetical protein